jgi:hypothetical protein
MSIVFIITILLHMYSYYQFEHAIGFPLSSALWYKQHYGLSESTMDRCASFC